MTLLTKHRKELEDGSGIDPEVIEERGYFSADTKAKLREKGFAEYQRLPPALVIPIWNVHGEIVNYQAKPDQPRIDRSRKKPRPVKYETPADSEVHLDVPPRIRHLLGDPTVPLWITEGVKKADCAASRDLCCIDLLGVNAWRGKNDRGGYTALGDWHAITLKSKTSGREVYIVFDSDAMLKREVYREMDRLAKWLESRGAVVFFIYLPTLPTGKKQGLDDFLVSGKTTWDLQSLASRELRPLPRSEEEQEEEQRGEFRKNYILAHDGLKYLKRGNDGTTTVPITTFRARILSRITRDDGGEQTYLYDVEARENGHVWRGQLSLSEWAKMEWPSRVLPTEAGLVPGSPSNAQHADFGFRQLSAPIEELTMYAHLGWRQIDDQWLYLHNDGAIGPEGAVSGVEVDSDVLSRYRLPEPPDFDEADGRAQLREAIRRSLGFLEVADRAQTWPILAAAYAAPLATTMPTDFTLWVRGVSGSRKSTMAALILNHFGTFNRYQLPANFTSTPNAIEIITFAAKDALLVVDDYAPAPDARTQQQQEQVAHRLLRGVGDQRGRQRSDKDSSKLRTDKFPRCLTLVTSELPVPGVQSSEARSLEVLWERDKVDLARLQRASEEDAPFYRVAMAGYVRWMAARMPRFQDGGSHDVKREVVKIRARMKGDHGRLPETAAKLLIGVWKFLQFAMEAEALTTEEAMLQYQEAEAAISACAERTGANQGERKPTAIFLTALRAIFNTGGGYLGEKTAGGRPDLNPQHWGWQAIAGGERTVRPNATKLGWVDQGSGQIWLDPEPTFQTVRQWVERSGMPFPGNKRSLGEALANEKLLTHTTEGRTKNTAQVKAEGKYEDVWSLAIGSVWATEEEAQASLPGMDAHHGEAS